MLHCCVVTACLILGGVFLQAPNSALPLFTPSSPLATLVSMRNKADPDQSLGSPPPFPTHPTLLFIIFPQVPIETLVCGPGRKPPCCWFFFF